MNLASLKYNNSKMVETCEEHLLPATAEAVKELLAQIITSGTFSRLSLENGKLLRVFRLVEKNEFQEDGSKIQSILQNATNVIELEFFSKSGWEQLARALQEVQQHNRWPVCWIVRNDTVLLKNWLDDAEALFLDSVRIPSLLGIPIQYDSTLSNDTILLTGSLFKDNSIKDLDLIIKISMDVLKYVSLEEDTTFGGI